MTSLRLNDHEQDYELSVPNVLDQTTESRVEESLPIQQENREGADLFNLARAISYRANARKRFSRATSVI